jgi:hypothetical protein
MHVALLQLAPEHLIKALFLKYTLFPQNDSLVPYLINVTEAIT